MTAPRGFQSVRRVLVPPQEVERVMLHLREAGRAGFEGIAFWLGSTADDSFTVSETYVPAQRAIRSPEGVCVTVAGQALFLLNKYLYERGLQLVAQIHSHPDEAYHSKTDDESAVVSTLGGISIVVPDFATREFDLRESATLRLVGPQRWVPLSHDAARSLVVIEE